MTDKEILIQKGKTFSLVVRWETEPIVLVSLQEWVKEVAK